MIKKKSTSLRGFCGPLVMGVMIAAMAATGGRALGQAADHGFRLEGHSQASEVIVTGSYWGWSRDGLRLERYDDGAFATTVTLPPGRHTYKFIVNGETWMSDPANPQSMDDGYGGQNSFVIIGNDNPVEAARVARPTYHWGETTWTLTGVPADQQTTWLPIKLSGEKPVYDPQPPSTATGRLLLSRDVISVPTSIRAQTHRPGYPLRARRILVWLPPGYDSQPNRRYPVLYMHDGQNVFDDPNCCFGNGGWEVNRALESLGESYATIVVGIPNSPERLLDLGLGSDAAAVRPTDYGRYLAQTIKPLIDREFRTQPERESTAIAGSSMGGIASIFAAKTFPEIYGRVGACSPAFFYRDDQGTSLGAVLYQRGRMPIRLYIDSGDSGIWNDGVASTRDYVELARKVGFQDNRDFLYIEEAGAVHNEGAWRRRTPGMLRWLLQPRARIPQLHTDDTSEGPAGG
jgi:predicted alpha/beta superfamily hydrolase